VLQFVVVYCSVLQCVLQCVAVCIIKARADVFKDCDLQFSPNSVTVSRMLFEVRCRLCCSVLQIVLQCVEDCVALCCSVLNCVALRLVILTELRGSR